MKITSTTLSLAVLALISFAEAIPAASSSTSTKKTSTTKTSTTTNSSTKTSTTTASSTKTSSIKTSSVKTSSVKTTVTIAKASTTAAATTTTKAATTTAPAAGGPCHVTAFADVPAATAACTAITLDGVAVPGGSTLDLSKLQQGTTVTFAGTTTFGYADADYDMIKLGGTDVHVTSAPGAIIDGNGQAWWDGQGSNGGVAKPDHFFVVSKAIGKSVIENLHIQNWPTHCFTISGSNGLVLNNIVLDNSAGDAPNSRSGGLAAAHNSDGFDISSTTGLTLSNSRVINQDDCVAITSGDSITVSNMYCNGGHGLSIGSVGGKSNNNVTNIIFEDSQILNSQNGARIKTNSGTTGYIANITYRNIFLQNISTYGIDIQQDYLNGGPTGSPTNGVTITGVTLTNITGTAQSKAKDYYILCGDGSCSDFEFNDIHVTGGTGDSCNFHPQGNFVC